MPPLPRPASQLSDCRVIALSGIYDPLGTLVPIAGNAEVPFSIARIFYIFGMPEGARRGGHAHLECRQLLICLRGQCRVEIDDGAGTRTVALETPLSALLVPPGLWVVQRYRSDAVALIVTDRPFDARDYIRDYGEFLAYRGVPARRAG